MSILMKANKKVAEIDTDIGKICGIKKIYDKRLLPIGVDSDNNRMLLKNLQSWQEMRAIPDNREGVKELIEKMEMSIFEAQEISQNISLIDTYWINSSKKEIKWEDINYVDNGFKNMFSSNIIFNSNFSDVNYRVPDFTTDGQLKKTWISTENGAILIKFGDLGEKNKEKNLLSANEIICSTIAKQMKVNAVNYFKVTVKGNKNLCGCYSFIKNSHTDFVNAFQIKKQFNLNSLELYYKFLEMGFQKEIDQMIAFDYLIHNTDRHEKNFGILMDADNEEIIDFAPIFDNGSCLGWNQEKGIPHFNESKPFINNFDEQIKLIDPNSIILPDKNFIETIINNTYKEFKIEEEQVKQAILEFRYAYKNLEKLKEKTKEIYFEEDR